MASLLQQSVSFLLEHSLQKTRGWKQNSYKFYKGDKYITKCFKVKEYFKVNYAILEYTVCIIIWAVSEYCIVYYV